MNIGKKLLSFMFVTSFAILFFYISTCGAYELTPEDKERIGSVGIKLYKMWTDTIGYSAIDIVKEMDPAPEIRPGLVITPENAKKYPGLKKILPDSLFQRLDPNHFLPHGKMIIVKTRPRYYPKAIIEGTRKHMGKCKINPDNLMLENYVCGVPFPRNPSPLEMAWNQVVAVVGMVDLYFDPLSSLTYSKARKYDTGWKAILGWYNCRSRIQKDFDPVTHESVYFKGKGIFQIGTFLVTYPQDLIGTAFLRYRYWDTNKPDLFMSYLPGLKRIRVLAGSDCQDPVIGAEMIWDNWAGDWQKHPSKTIFPNEYKLSEPMVMLFPIYPSGPSVEIQGESFITRWEKRPVWILEIKSLDPNYVYGKRILYIDMELFKLIYAEDFDRRGNLWRVWEEFRFMAPDGYNTWEAVNSVNYINQRSSVYPFNPHVNPELDPADFDMRWLTRMAR